MNAWMIRPAQPGPGAGLAQAASTQGDRFVAVACAIFLLSGFLPVTSGQSPATAPAGEPPAAFGPFLQWASRELQTWPQPAPLPTDPGLPPPKWNVIRLATRKAWDTAKVESTFKPSAKDAAPLVTIGPFRSDQPSENLAVERIPRPSPREEDLTGMILRGFSVLREEVGAIDLVVRVPHGRDFTLRWDQGGAMPVPVKSNTEPFNVRISTADLPKWSGKLESIEIRTKGIGRGIVEVRSLAMLPRSESFPHAAAVERIRIQDEARDAIYIRGTARIRFPDIAFPRDARITLGLASMRPKQAPAPRVELVAIDQSGETSLFSRELGAAEGWDSARIDAKSMGGKTAALELRVTAENASIVTILGNPTVYEPVASPPLVVIYLIDTLGAAHCNLYGYPRETTPFLAQLANQGAWFPEMFANNSRTIESIPSLMLSMPIERHGVYHPSTTAPPALSTLAEVLQAAGFATVSFCTNVNAGPNTGMDQGFDTFLDRIGHYFSSADRTIPLDESSNWLETYRDRPCFIYAHTAEPHAPYAPPEGFSGRFTAGYSGPISGSMDGDKRFRLARSSRDIAHVVGLHDEEILYADSRLAKFVELLKKVGRLEQTTLFVTSDHGEQFLEHGYWEHGLDLHAELTRIPLVVTGPEIARGAACQTPAQLFDVMPTILDLFGLPPPHAMEGRSLLPELRGGAGSQPGARKVRQILASNHNFRPVAGRLEYSVTEPGQWKVFFKNRVDAPGTKGGRSRFRLFDLRSDKAERNNVLMAHPEEARRLILDLVEWRRAQRPYGAIEGTQRTEIGHRQMQDLEALGYVGGQNDESDEPDDADTAP